MAQYIGKERFETDMLNNRTKNSVNGLLAERTVADLLSLYLPDDTYVIHHPIIGVREPDLLIISPRYGFRIVEIKEWSSLGSIIEVQTNGTMVFQNGDLQNPIDQVKKHANDLIEYLKLNYPHHFRDMMPVGYIVLHFGFNKYDFSSKFPNLSNDYWSYNLFKNQLDQNIDNLLSKASKFKKDELNEEVIKTIISKIKIKDLDIKNEPLSNISQRVIVTDQTNSEIIQANASVISQTIKWKNIGYALIVSIVIVFALSFYLKNNAASKNTTNDIKKTNDSQVILITSKESYFGKKIVIFGNVKRFTLDSKSNTKFLLLEDSSGTMEAVIFKDIKVPFIKEGEIYNFIGVIKEFKGTLELEVSEVKGK